MKKKPRKLLFLAAIFFAVPFAASSQARVKTQAPAPMTAGSPQPARVQVWIDEEWVRNEGHYRYTGSHWETPPHPGYIRQPGYWKHYLHRRDEWVPGKWKIKQ